jgi:hypothetical protein
MVVDNAAQTLLLTYADLPQVMEGQVTLVDDAGSVPWRVP